MKIFARSLLLVGLVGALLGGYAVTQAEDGVTFETSMECYAVGDSVYFTLTNHRDSAIYVPSLPPWRQIWDASADTAVYNFWAYYIIWGVDPDSSLSGEWDQTDYHSNQVPQGQYWLEVKYARRMDPDSAWPFTVAATFYVGGASSLERGTWGRIKSLYR